MRDIRFRLTFKILPEIEHSIGRATMVRVFATIAAIVLTRSFLIMLSSNVIESNANDGIDYPRRGVGKVPDFLKGQQGLHPCIQSQQTRHESRREAT